MYRSYDGDIVQYHYFTIIEDLGLVHATLKEFEKGGFTLKTDQMFCVHTTPEEFKHGASL